MTIQYSFKIDGDTSDQSSLFVAKRITTTGCEYTIYGVLADMISKLVDRRESEARAAALDEAASLAAREGVFPELNVYAYADGSDWYKHGQRIAAAIRALKDRAP